MDTWKSTDILITVRAYPEPSRSYVETSCVAGVSSDGVPLRLFPIPARTLDDSRKFKKYSIIKANIRKASSDPRPESHNIDLDSIQFVREVGTKNGWQERNDMVAPLRHSNSIESLEETFKELKAKGAPSLALIRPKEIESFTISPRAKKEWSEDDLAKLGQQIVFDSPSPGRRLLEFIPYDFRYTFRCDHPRCKGHSFKTLDWEVNQSYRKWRYEYGQSWKEFFLQKYRDELPERDLQFFVGTIKNHPQTWTIIGIYYPPKPKDEEFRMDPLF